MHEKQTTVLQSSENSSSIKPPLIVRTTTDYERVSEIYQTVGGYEKTWAKSPSQQPCQGIQEWWYIEREGGAPGQKKYVQVIGNLPSSIQVIVGTQTCEGISETSQESKYMKVNNV